MLSKLRVTIAARIFQLESNPRVRINPISFQREFENRERARISVSIDALMFQREFNPRIRVDTIIFQMKSNLRVRVDAVTSLTLGLGC